MEPHRVRQETAYPSLAYGLFGLGRFLLQIPDSYKRVIFMSICGSIRLSLDSNGDSLPTLTRITPECPSLHRPAYCPSFDGMNGRSYTGWVRELGTSTIRMHAEQLSFPKLQSASKSLSECSRIGVSKCVRIIIRINCNFQ